MKKHKAPFVYLAAFMLPACILLIVYIYNHCAPFGNNSIATADARMQYLDLFQYLRNVLNGKDSFIYSFRHFMGSTGIGTFAYYLVSPFNILILFFKRGQETSFFSIVVLLKIATCGFTCSVYLKNRFKNLNDLMCVLLSAGYALMHYNIYQARNIMWLDGVYMLPLILLGTYYIVRNGRSKLYITALCGTLVFNWYTGYFNCIAVLIYFFFESCVINETFSLKQLLKRVIEIGIHTFAAIGLGAVLLIPVLRCLNNGKAGTIEFELENGFNGNILNVFFGFITGYSGYTKEFIVLFCGSLTFLGLILYFTDRNIRLKERAGSLIVVFIMIMLAYYKPIEFVMNGFRECSSYWYRFAYISVFYCIWFAAREFENIESTAAKRIIYGGGVCAVLVLFSCYMNSNKMLKNAYTTACIVILISIILSVYISGNRKKIVSIFMIGMISAELMLNAHQVFNGLSFADSNLYYEYANKQIKLSDKLKKLDSGFYRVGQTSYLYMENGITSNYDEPLAYGYNGISHYSSTYDENQAKLLCDLGYSSMMLIGVNNTRIVGSDSLLGVKYIISDTAIPGLDAVSESIYKNPYVVNPAIIYNNNDVAVKYTENPFEYQNELFSKLIGHNVEIYSKLETEVIQSGNESEFSVSSISDSDIIYFWAKTSYRHNSEVYSNDEFVSKYDCWLSPKSLLIPHHEKKLIIKMTNTGDGKEIKDYGIYKLNTDVLNTVVTELNKTSPQNMNISDGKAYFEVDGKVGQSMLVQIPTNSGWRVMINGKSVKTEKFAGCLYSIPLENGKCEITMEYHLPGLKLGIVMTIMTLVVLIIIKILEKYKKLRINW